MKKISVLYGASNEYTPYAGISITSLLENNRYCDITIYYAGISLDNSNRVKLIDTVAHYGQRIVFLNTIGLQDEIQAFGCEEWNSSYATWLRFFVLDQIPDTVDIILNIDSDTVVLEDVSEVFNIELDDHPVAAVCDALGMDYRRSLGFTDEEAYYNGGIVLFNLKIWREQDLYKRMMTHLKSNVSRYRIFDQDLLNDFFKHKIKRLPQKYNTQGVLLAYKPEQYFHVYSSWKANSYYSIDESKSAIDKPIILHYMRFMGDYPWNKKCNCHPCKMIYREWKDKSEWKNICYENNNQKIVFIIEKILFLVLPRTYFLMLFRHFTKDK